MQYQHSETFATLKTIKEQIKVNLTSYQWLATLDHFIESALDPIVTAYPDYLDNYFSKVVAWQTNKPSVKFSRNDKGTLPALLFNSLTTEDAVKRGFQKDMMFNRGVLFGAINSYLATTSGYMLLHDPRMKLKKARRRLLIQRAQERTSEHLYEGTQECQYWATKAFSFKEMIVQKYVRLALMSAKRTYEQVQYRQKLDDIVQTYLVYLSKAIDRCDSRQGVLTTFIQTWFYSARSEIQRSVLEEEQNSSYEELIENGVFADATQPDCKYEALQHLASVAKQVDPEGALRYALGIPELFTSAQRKLLMNHKAKL